MEATDNESLCLGERVVAAQQLIFKLQSKRPAIQKYITFVSSQSLEEAAIQNSLAGIESSVTNLRNQLKSPNSEPKGFKYFGKSNNIFWLQKPFSWVR